MASILKVDQLQSDSGTVTIASNIAFTGASTFVSNIASPIITGTMNLAGGQIKFPATQNSSADANTLDDYEEGTWSPIISGVLTGFTYSSGGQYTKIGRLIHITGYIKYTNVSFVALGSEDNYISLSSLPTSPSGIPLYSASVGTWTINPSSGTVQNRFFTGAIDSGTIISSYQVIGNTDIYFSSISGNNPLSGNTAIGDVISFSLTFHNG
jgi:hypothetical protein